MTWLVVIGALILGPGIWLAGEIWDLRNTHPLSQNRPRARGIDPATRFWLPDPGPGHGEPGHRPDESICWCIYTTGDPR